MLPCVLTIAGSDPCAGAGLQADLKTITALGGYGATVVTAITVQNSVKVSQVHPVEGSLVAAQMRAVLSDLPIKAIKLGMLGNRGVVEAVLSVLDHYPEIPVVADTVLRGSAGGALLADEDVAHFVQHLLPRCHLITPNLDEAQRLTGLEGGVGVADLESLAYRLMGLGCGGVVLTGGHLVGNKVVDTLVCKGGIKRWIGEKIASKEGFHGTGCTLASAVALGVAKGLDDFEAVEEGIAYVRQTIRRSIKLGSGQRFLGHG
ncbi:phosphomethylpyrimidine kinase [Magnetococcus marinus MC-1]|uniref:hydroxymethylpyrimidine kinase n=1 Tax=Magnetococcus marinus (strain ATCC BAA-1437 / JCM 17883 / MC-1) TaxID=156889 RepID=A0L3K0_MAGMM|nr:bifunctional hydroxymethylpyrimidine kinase/phosphomethylpyrimidine kinase [Magnetococcus marinus]ABK42543.1 phosphomethylpyrimidine kinase [Magnetococcus marinus MC-1]